MEIVDNKALLLEVADPETITAVIRKSAVIEQVGHTAKVAVHWGHREAETLAKLRMDTPSPILRDYKWTGKHTRSTISVRPRRSCPSGVGLFVSTSRAPARLPALYGPPTTS